MAKILKKYGIDDYHWKPEIASEIDALTKAHYFEFVEWIDFGSHPFVPWWDAENGVITKWYTDEVNEKRWTLDEVYNYWLENYKNRGVK